MPPDLEELWKYAPVVVLLLLAFYAGHRGLWFWGPGVRLHFQTLERERDEWRRIALRLMKQQGIDINGDPTGPASHGKDDVR